MYYFEHYFYNYRIIWGFTSLLCTSAVYSLSLMTSMSWYRCTIHCWTFSHWRPCVLSAVWVYDEQSFCEYVCKTFDVIMSLLLLEILPENAISWSCFGSICRFIRNCHWFSRVLPHFPEWFDVFVMQFLGCSPSSLALVVVVVLRPTEFSYKGDNGFWTIHWSFVGSSVTH